MNIGHRTVTKLQSFLKSYGPSPVKKLLWDHEFSGDKWNFIDNTLGDCVYTHLEKYAAMGDILDLGCGPGNTANEIEADTYGKYIGLDISEEALRKAASRSQRNGRADRNRFIQGDFIAYVPDQLFKVILFRESMYHVPVARIKPMLDHYSRFLTTDGVFIVRMGTQDGQGNPKPRPLAMAKIIEDHFDVVQNARYSETGVSVLVFRPKVSSRLDAVPALSRSDGSGQN